MPQSDVSPASKTADVDFHWKGFTQMADHEPLVISRAEGCWLETADGRRLLDGVANLWCNVHGHRNPVIDSAIRRQLDRVAHVTTLGMSADVTDELAETLAGITPGDLRHCFFSSDGASAVEAALKMAFQYWQQRDVQHAGVAGDAHAGEASGLNVPSARSAKTRFLALGSAYHGDTTGAVSLGGIKHFHRLFEPILFEAVRGPMPCSYRYPADVSADSLCNHYASLIEELIRDEHETLAAVVMEPLVQGAAGMVTHPPGLLRRVREMCDHFDVLLVCDEVATGFGRTGRLFACEHEQVTPDILCLGKGLTGGYLPLAATVARPHVFRAFLGPAESRRQFFHGHTFGGNPLAAAAALASIKLFEDNEVISTLDAKSDRLRQRLSRLNDHPHVGDIRGRGLMIGIELVVDRESKTPFDKSFAVGREVCRHAVENGVWVRPLGDVVILMPPLVASEQELDLLADTVIHAIEQVCRVTDKLKRVARRNRSDNDRSVSAAAP